MIKPLLLGLAVGVLAACGDDAAKPAPSVSAGPQPVPLEDALSVLVIERQPKGGAFAWAGRFAEATGCKTTIDRAQDRTALLDALDAADYDVVVAPGEVALRLVMAGEVRPLDMAQLPSYPKLHPRLREGPWQFVDGVHYGVPYQWGANVLMYDHTVFPTPPSSWSVVLQPSTLPDGSSNAGRVQAYAEPIHIGDAALYLKSHRPQLRITDPFALSPTQYAAALRLLRDQRALVQQYWLRAPAQVSAFAEGKVAAASTWLYQVAALRALGQPVSWTMPSEGATGWADTSLLVDKARHPHCAHAWMEYSIGADAQRTLAADVAALPAVPSACGAPGSAEATACAQKGMAYLDDIHFARLPEARCGSADCVPYSRWTRDYLTLIDGWTPPEPAGETDQ